MGRSVLGRLDSDRLLLRTCEFGLQRTCDRSCDVALDRKTVIEFAIKALSPQMRVTSGVIRKGIEGMRIGGRRLLKISPHLAFRERGIPGIVPPNAVLTVEVTVLEKLSGD